MVMFDDVVKLLRYSELCKSNKAREAGSQFHNSGELQDLKWKIAGGRWQLPILFIAPAATEVVLETVVNIGGRDIEGLEVFYKFDNNLSTYTHTIDEMSQSLSSLPSTKARQRMLSQNDLCLE